MTAWSRMGMAFGNGAPPGAAFGIAASTASDDEAKQVGQAAKSVKSGGSSTGVDANGNLLPGYTWAGGTGVAVPVEQGATVDPSTGQEVNNAQVQNDAAAAGGGIGAGMAWLNRFVWSPGSDAIEALARASDDTKKVREEDGLFAGLGDIGKAVSQEWHVARTENNTPGQVMNLQFGGATVQEPILGKDGKVTGYKTIPTRTWDENAKRWVYPLLDDPENQAAQDEYFKSGARRWTTGFADLVITTATDPTIYGGEALKAAHVGQLALGAGDAELAYKASAGGAKSIAEKKAATEAAAKEDQSYLSKRWVDPEAAVPGVVDDPLDDAAKIKKASGKANAFENQTRKAAEAMHSTITTGNSIARYARDPLVSQAADSGAILALAKRAAEVGGGREAEVQRIQKVLLAGAGSESAYSDIANESRILGMEVDAVTAPNAAAARQDLNYFNISHDDRLGILDKDDQLNKLQEAVAESLKQHAKVIAKRDGIDSALERLKAVGTNSTDQWGGVGGISHKVDNGITQVIKPGTRRLTNAAVEHVYSMSASPFLPAVHFFAGRAMPGVIRLDGDTAVADFEAHAYQAAKVAKRTKNPELMQAINDARDKFATASAGINGDLGIAASTRHDAVIGLQKAMRDDMVGRLSAKHNISPTDLGKLLDQMQGRREAELRHASTRAKQAVAASNQLVLNSEDGLNVMPDALRDDLVQHGEIVNATPFNEAAQKNARAISTGQFARTVTLQDWSKLDRQVSHLAGAGSLKRLLEAGQMLGHGTSMALDALSDFWKFGVLFRPMAYLIRNQLDTQARVDAEIGPMAHGLMAAKAMGNRVSNWKRITRIDAAQYQMRLGLHDTVDTAQDELAHGALNAQDRVFWEKRLAHSQSLLSLDPEAFEAHMLERFTDPETGAVDLPKSLQGRTSKGSTNAKAIQGTRFRYSAGGQAIEQADRLTAAYKDLPDFLRKTDDLDATNMFMGFFSDSSNQALARMRTRAMESTGHYQNVAFDPTRPQLAQQWTDAYVKHVNHYIRTDAVNRMILSGSSDREILTWLKEDPAGRAYWHALNKNSAREAATADTTTIIPKYSSPAELVQTQRDSLEKMLPTADSRSVALAHDITADDINTTFEDFPRPAVPTESMRSLGPGAKAAGTIGDKLSGFRNGYFRLFSSMPESMMGRHPLFMTYYRNRMADAIGHLSQEGKDELTLNQVHKIRARVDYMARRDVARVVFDTTAKTPAQNASRWLIPFYGAWQDTMVKWARIQGDNPAAIPGLIKAFTVPSRVFQVQDENGNIIRTNGDVTDPVSGKTIATNANPLSGYWVIGLPKHFPGSSGTNNTIKIRRDSLNVIFQGEPFWMPGPGPVLTVGVGEIANKVLPEFGLDPAEAFSGKAPKDANWLEKFGVKAGQTGAKWGTAGYGLSSTSLADQVAPSWLRVAKSQFAHDDAWKAQFNQEYLAIAGQVARGELSKNLTTQQIEKMATKRTRNWYILRLLGTESPVSTTPGDPLEFYTDRFRAYQNTYSTQNGYPVGTAQDQFMKDYPEFGEATISMTANQSGINATIPAEKAYTKYKGAVDANPKYGWAVVGPDNVSGYDSNVFAEQRSNGLRVAKDPTVAWDAVQADKGWTEYNAAMVKLNGWMVDAGVTSLHSEDGAPYEERKQKFIAQLESENPAWKQSFASAGAGDSQVQFLDAMQTSIKDYPGLGKRSDMMQLRTYLAQRKLYREAMVKYGVSTLRTTDNPDGTVHYADTPGGQIAQQWDAWTQGLYDESDPVFKAMFDRARLGDDDLSNPVAGEK